MSITHHPDDSTLMSYAAGALPGALAPVAAAHVALCARCRHEVAAMELMGGALVAELPAAALERPVPPVPEMDRSLAGTLAPEATAAMAEVPPPLKRLLGDSLDAIRWRWISPGQWLRRLPIAGGGRLHLFRCAPGAPIPEHGHRGSELTLVLRGTLVDGTARFAPGDLCDLDEETEHTPAGGPDGCICIVAHDHPVRWRSLIVRLARPWHRM
jgi:putative transcriptional regulator